mmetsp:Transcript_21612/g.74368  ORF Transcript_21612/g.74368 Transcript_21612/m.74368 type:complete len:635 (+) Transcript_21612:347-2251(+)
MEAETPLSEVSQADDETDTLEAPSGGGGAHSNAADFGVLSIRGLSTGALSSAALSSAGALSTAGDECFYQNSPTQLSAHESNSSFQEEGTEAVESGLLTNSSFQESRESSDSAFESPPPPPLSQSVSSPTQPTNPLASSALRSMASSPTISTRPLSPLRVHSPPPPPPHRSAKRPVARRSTKLQSAFARFMGKDAPDADLWAVDLREIEAGPPRLEVGGRGDVLLAYEEQPTTIIAHSLNTPDYKRALRAHLDNHLISRAAAAEPLAQTLELQLISPQQTHVRHRFADVDDQGGVLCKFVCQAYWATQFAAVRSAYCGGDGDGDYLKSLATAQPWNAQGGKSGATFLKSADGRFVCKQITRTELQMFLEYAPQYFEYLSKTLFHGAASLLVKVLGVYQIGSHNRITGKRVMEQVVVMENLFHERRISRAFDLKGSTRSRYTHVSKPPADGAILKPDAAASNAASNGASPGAAAVSLDDRAAEAAGAIVDDDEPDCGADVPVLLDENFTEACNGRPFPLRDVAKMRFDAAVSNDTAFLSAINVVDYSILAGFDETRGEVVCGVIDYFRQYDMAKKMERMGKSVGMIAGQAEPTVIQPPNYRQRFRAAMERYFMTVPDSWTLFRAPGKQHEPRGLL